MGLELSEIEQTKVVNPIKVLLIENDEEDYILAKSLLKRVQNSQYNLDWESEYESGLAHLLRGNYDVCLLDHILGKKNGIDFLSEVVKNSCQTPIIMLTGMGNWELDKSAMASGAVDYLTKQDLSPALLERSIRYAIDRMLTHGIIKKERDKFKSLFDAVPSSIAWIKSDLTYISVNETLGRQIKIDPKEFVGREVGFFIQDKSLKKIYTEFVKTIIVGSGSDHVIEFPFTHHGQVIETLLIGRHYDPEFEAIIIGVDITGRKNAENQVRLAKEDAMRAAQAKGNFLAHMSHEIRTPLNGIIGVTELLKQTDMSKEQEEYTNVILHSSEALSILIDDILDFSKIEAGKLSFDKGDFHFSEFIHDILKIVSPKSQKKNIDLNSYISPNIPVMINGDQSRIRQIVLNFLSNSIKFTEKGSIELTAELVEKNENNLKMKISVRDSGMGIPQNQIGYLFKSFSQVHHNPGKTHGTGLGLAISRQLAELMGGQVGVESKEGSGSLFWFTAWLKQATDQAPEGSTPKQLESNLYNNPIQEPAIILLAEDNPINQRVTKRTLEKLGCIVDIAENGEKVLEVIVKKPYTLILMDCQMPIMDGYQTTRVIRQMDFPISNIPIIALTANAMKGDMEKCLNSGMNDYLAKPVKMVDLGNIVKKWAVPQSTPIQNAFEKLS